MYKEISKYEFHDAFKDRGRGEQFSYEGKEALFNYLEQLEEDTGEKIELDVIALCCEYTEYANLEELKENYNNIETMEDLENETTVIKINDNALIIQSY